MILLDTEEGAMKPLCFILTACLVLGLSACGGSVAPPSSPIAAEPTGVSPTVTASPGPAPQEIQPVLATPRAISPQACLLADLLMGEGLWELRRFAWSPTGDRLAYVGPAGPPDSSAGSLMLVAAPRFDTPQLIAPGAAGDPTWSPDGSRLAFVAFRADDQVGTIIAVDVETLALLDLLPGDMARTDPGAGYKAIDSWPAERLLVMTNCGTGCRQPWYLDPRTSTMEPVFRFSQQGASYAWSPDRTAAVVTGGAAPQIGIVLGGEGEISWLSGHGTPDSAWTFFADWSPDASRFLFLRQSGQAAELWEWNTRTGEGSPLLSGVIAARWSPHGDRIALVMLGQPRFTADGQWQDVTVTPQGPNPLWVGIYPYPDPEGNLMALFEIGQVDWDYSALVETMQSRSLAPLWSPDGKNLLYHDGMGRMWVLSVDELSRYEMPARGYAAEWSPDGKNLAVATSDRLQIFAVPCSP